MVILSMSRVVPEIFLAMLMLATVATALISALSCVLPPFDFLTCGSTEGSQGRFHVKMQKGAVVVEAWTWRDGADATTSTNTFNGILGFYYSTGMTQIKPGNDESLARAVTEVYRRKVWSCPGWFLVMVFTSVPTFVFRQRGKKPKPGHCGCGYDLTGNVSGTCPECGQPTGGVKATVWDNGCFD